MSNRCDHCFEGCNPWRQVCPPKAPEGLPCTECPGRATSLANCNGNTICIENVELACASTVQKCCDTYAEELTNLGIIDLDQAKDYVCPAPKQGANEATLT